MPEKQEPISLERIEIRGLFGRFDYDVTLQAGGITILTGPNGYGKTTILNAVYQLARGNPFFFQELHFTLLLFRFGLNNTIVITKENEIPRITINKSNRKVMGDILYRKIGMGPDRYNLDKLNRHWFFRGGNRVISSEEVFNLTSKIASGYSIAPFKLQPVHLIREQRLFHRTKGPGGRSRFPEESAPPIEETIENYAQELREYIRNIQAESAVVSQELDGSFPRRLFDEENEIEEAPFNQRFEAIRDIQRGLNKFKLLHSQGDDHPTYKRENAKALFVYLEDTEKKQAVYRELLTRLELFTSILNKRRFSFKQLVVDNEAGFLIVSDKGDPLSLADLSSGEKQEIILLFELIFKAKPGTLVLIDEPELSLHVAWQKAFLEDLARIIAINRISVIVATHSPQIINGQWDLMVDLEEISR